MSFTATVVEMSEVDTTGPADDVKGRFEETYGVEPETKNGWFHPTDWPRAAYVLSRMEAGEKVLDVGVGAGQFLNMVALSGKHAVVAGVDKAKFSKYVEFSDLIERKNGSIAELEYADDSFDVVTCMEVLEHVPSEVFTAGVAELRRVCRGQLLMTVPFEEPEPLSKNHVRRFTREDVEELFPNGRYTILNRRRMPWVLIEERLDGKPFTESGGVPFTGVLAQPPAEPKTPAEPKNPAAPKAPALSAEQRRIKELEATIAKLNARKSVRAANLAGKTARRVLRKAKSLRG